MPPPSRPLIGVIWLIAAAIVLLGGWKLLHLDHRSADQNILIQKFK